MQQKRVDKVTEMWQKEIQCIEYALQATLCCICGQSYTHSEEHTCPGMYVPDYIEEKGKGTPGGGDVHPPTPYTPGEHVFSAPMIRKGG